MEQLYSVNTYLANKVTCNPTLPAVTSNTPITLKADSGASQTYLKPEHAYILENYKRIINGPEATLPNNERIKPEGAGLLPLTNSMKLQSLVYPKLTSKSLLSV